MYDAETALYLKRCQVHGDAMEVAQDLVDEWLRLAGLLENEVPSAFLRNLDESVTGHILHT